MPHSNPLPPAPLWLTHSQLTPLPDAPTLDWLFDEGSLTRRLTRLSDDLQHRERMITMGVFDPEPERDIWLDEISPTESTDSTVDAKYYDYQSGAFGEGLK